MTSRPPVSGEPRTEAGRDLLQRCESGWKTWMDEPIRVNGMRRMILAIEAEASTGAALIRDHVAETLHMMAEHPLGGACVRCRIDAEVFMAEYSRRMVVKAEYARLAEQEG